MKVLIAGATGLVGSETARLLAGEGASVRGLVRTTSDSGTVRALEQAGVETVVGDLRDAESLRTACHGVDVVISTVSASPFGWSEESTFADVDRDGTKRLVDAAKEAAAKRFLFVSFPHGPEPGFPLGDAKAAAEQYIQESGLEYCIVAANFFMEVWLSPGFGFDYESGSATIPGDGSNACSFVSCRDVARAIVKAATEPKPTNGVVFMGGPEALSLTDVIKTFESADGRSWQVTSIPVEAIQKQLQAAGNEFEQSVAMLQLASATVPSAMDPSHYPVRESLTTVQDYARAVSKQAARK